MKVGIVGSEGAKFTPLGQERARKAINDLIDERTTDDEIPTVVSGECHLGGIDIWAKEIALDWNCGYIGFPPRELNWAHGYKPRNLQIAHNSDIVYCITVDKLPAGYDGMKFDICYHCAKNGRDGSDHVKSGGCWTVIQAMKLGKQGKWITIANE